MPAGSANWTFARSDQRCWTSRASNSWYRAEEEKRQELEEKADNYEADYAQGQADGLAGRGKAKNTAGYNAGYANGQKQRKAKEAAKSEEVIISEEVTYDRPKQQAETTNQNSSSTEEVENTTIESQPETKTVMTIERDGVVYETQVEKTSKVKSYGAQV